MPRPLRYVLITLTAGIALLLLLAGLLAANFDPNDYKPQIIQLVQQKKQRTLSIPGQIKLRFFPGIGADLGAVSLSERGSAREFAAIGSARVSLALWPLLKKKVVVDQVMIDGARIELLRDKDGKMNIDDLLSKETDDNESAVKFDIDSVHIQNARLLLDDQMQHRHVEIGKLNFQSGRIANGVPSSMDLQLDIKADQPQLDAHLSLATSFTIDTEKQTYRLENWMLDVNGKALDFNNLGLKMAGALDMQKTLLNVNDFSILLQGSRGAQQVELKLLVPKLALQEQDAKGDKVTLEGKMTQGKRTLRLDLKLPSVKGNKSSVTLPGTLMQVGVQDTGLDARASVSADWQLDLNKMLLQTQKMQWALDGKQGDVTLAGKLAAQLQLDGLHGQVALNQLAGQLTLPNPHGGEMKLNLEGSAKWAAQRLSSQFRGQLDDSHFELGLGMQEPANPLFDLNLTLDQLDLNKYQAKEVKPAPAKAGQASDTPLPDLSGLKTLRLNAAVQLGQLKLAKLQLSQLHVNLHAGQGKLELNPLAANLYGGRIEGLLSATTSDNPHIHLKQTLSNVALGPLLGDAMQTAPIDGKAQVALDLESHGSRISELKQALNGSAKLRVQDGAVRGFNLAEIVRHAKARLGGGDDAGAAGAGQSGTAAGSDKTDFSELAASFVISNGVAHNDDLTAKSPLFRVGGSGDINLGQDRLDYLLKTTIVPSLQGQGGPELQALKGLTVPVRLSGPFANIGWKLELASLIGDTVKKKAEEKVMDGLKDKLKGLFK